jgi:glycosidase
MTERSARPVIYEINTHVWLNSLSSHYQQAITLENVPDEVLDELTDLRVNTIWLMGVWQRSEAARQSALNYTHEYRPALPDLTADDIIGSAYAIASYEIDTRLGGRDALATLRSRLHERGLRLILDFVPNHIAMDHPWTVEHPEYLVRGSAKTARKHAGMFYRSHDKNGRELHIAHGRDPYFPAWIDTAQVNAFAPAYRQVARETLLDIAAQCDGVRCDMAMLLVNDIFQQTWGDFVDDPIPETDFWPEIIPEIKQQYPDFVFIAEVYWNMEHHLQQQGFDYTYDKPLYDRIVDGDPGAIRLHLQADNGYQDRLVRFIENHDEPRAAATLGSTSSRAAATLICTLPGAVLLHDGQLSGRGVKLPVQIARQPDETPHHGLHAFYRRLLAEIDNPVYHAGEWSQLEITPAHRGVESHHNLLAYSWRREDELRLIVINITSEWSQGRIQLDGWRELLTGGFWRLHDALSRDFTYRDGAEIEAAGLHLELEAFQARIFHFEALDEERRAVCIPDRHALMT